MKKVGLTGGIGSGKSYVAKIFQELGVAVYNSDERAKALMIESSVIRKSLTLKFGDEVYQGHELNRPFLADKIFTNQANLDFVNNLVHPVVAQDFDFWLKLQTSPYVINELAILFETGGEKSMDFSVLVTAPPEIQIERVSARNGWAESEIIDRMSKQWTNESKEKLADFCILNDGKTMLLQQILKIHENIIGTTNS
ncbi:MAG: dephospho-CoA kinase [Flavobacteriales bacterium]|jgi:dephospho-CoA kinase